MPALCQDIANSSKAANLKFLSLQKCPLEFELLIFSLLWIVSISLHTSIVKKYSCYFPALCKMEIVILATFAGYKHFCL